MHRFLLSLSLFLHYTYYFYITTSLFLFPLHYRLSYLYFSILIYFFPTATLILFSLTSPIRAFSSPSRSFKLLFFTPLHTCPYLLIIVLHSPSSTPTTCHDPLPPVPRSYTPHHTHTLRTLSHPQPNPVLTHPLLHPHPASLLLLSTHTASRPHPEYTLSSGVSCTED